MCRAAAATFSSGFTFWHLRLSRCVNADRHKKNSGQPTSSLPAVSYEMRGRRGTNCLLHIDKKMKRWRDLGSASLTVRETETCWIVDLWAAHQRCTYAQIKSRKCNVPHIHVDAKRCQSKRFHFICRGVFILDCVFIVCNVYILVCSSLHILIKGSTNWSNKVCAV